MSEFNPEMPASASQVPSTSRDLTSRSANAWEDASGAWRRGMEVVRREVEQRPFRTALISVGAGYLLGGGLFTALTARLVGTSVRVALKSLALPAVASGAVSLGRHFLSDNETRTSRFD